MNNFLATYYNALNRTSCVAVASHAKNTPPVCKSIDNQLVVKLIVSYIRRYCLLH